MRTTALILFQSNGLFRRISSTKREFSFSCTKPLLFFPFLSYSFLFLRGRPSKTIDTELHCFSALCEKMKIERCGNCRSRNLTYNFGTGAHLMSLECWQCRTDESIAGCVKMVKLKFKFMFGWKGIECSIDEMCVLQFPFVLIILQVLVRTISLHLI